MNLKPELFASCCLVLPFDLEDEFGMSLPKCQLKYHQKTRCHNAEQSALHSHLYEDLESLIIISYICRISEVQHMKK
jgi:hypothetical protein